MGFVMLGLFAANSAGVQGALLQMLNHGVSTGALFLLVGVVYDRRHTRMVSEFGGLAKVMPVYTTLFIIVTMSSIGVPGTNGFVGEFMVLMGTFLAKDQFGLGSFAHLQGVLASTGVILAAVYMLSVVQKVFFGPLKNRKNFHLPDINVRESIAVAPLIGMIFIIGFFPNLFLNRMAPSVDAVLEQYRAHRTEFTNQGEGEARLLGRSGSVLEMGYPEAPKGPEGTAEAAPAAGEEKAQ